MTQLLMYHLEFTAFYRHNPIKFARDPEFDVRTTLTYSLKSIGMAEVFVKTFKRDYISLCEPSDAITLMNHFPENALQKGWKMMSSRFI